MLLVVATLIKMDARVVIATVAQLVDLSGYIWDMIFTLLGNSMVVLYYNCPIVRDTKLLENPRRFRS